MSVHRQEAQAVQAVAAQAVQAVLLVTVQEEAAQTPVQRLVLLQVATTGSVHRKRPANELQAWQAVAAHAVHVISWRVSALGQEPVVVQAVQSVTVHASSSACSAGDATKVLVPDQSLPLPVPNRDNRDPQPPKENRKGTEKEQGQHSGHLAKKEKCTVILKVPD